MKFLNTCFVFIALAFSFSAFSTEKLTYDACELRTMRNYSTGDFYYYIVGITHKRDGYNIYEFLYQTPNRDGFFAMLKDRSDAKNTYELLILDEVCPIQE